MSIAFIYLLSEMRRELEILNELGLHARPSAEFVRRVMRFQSDVSVWRGDDQFSGGSILEMMSANLDCGTRVVLEAVGPDAEEALDCLEQLLKDLQEQEGSCRE